MIALPIATRELLVLARNPLTYRGRWITALVIFIISGGFSVLFSTMGRRGGGQILESISFYVFIYCLVAGVQSTADTLSKEKREGTMGLLFLTLLKSVDVVLGKLIAGSVATFYGLLAGFPMLALVLLQGGVAGRDLAQLFLASVNALFVAASIGLFTSSVSTSRKAALAGATWLGLALCLGVPGLSIAAQFHPQWQWAAQPLSAISLPHTFRGALQMPTFFAVKNFWTPLAGTHLLGWIFLALAVFNLPRKWQDRPAQGKGMPLKDRFRQWTFGKPAVRRAWRNKLLAQNPFLWLTARDRLKPLGPWLLFCIITGVFTWIAMMSGFDEEMLPPYLVLNAVAFKFMLCGIAPQKLVEEKENGTLELLLSTPLSVAAMIRGQFHALWLHVRGPFILQLLLQILTLIYLFLDSSSGIADGALLVGAIGFIAFFVIDFFVIALIGMWSAMIVKNYKQVNGATIARALLPPGLVFVGTILLMLGLNLLLGLSLEIPEALLAPYYFLLSAANAILWTVYVRKNLPRKMRELAFERYSKEEKQPWWAALFSRKPRTPPALAAS